MSIQDNLLGSGQGDSINNDLSSWSFEKNVPKNFDVAVDVRKSSRTFSKWVGIELSQRNKKQFWIPSGFAHGFITLTDSAEVLYKASGFWDKNCERTIKWDDEDIDIDWPLEKIGIKNPFLSEKDSQASSLKDLLLKDDLFL